MLTINLSGDREEFVRSLLHAGDFASEIDVVEEALRLLEERSIDQASLSALRREIAVGVAQADRGELAPFEPQATLARVRARPANMGNVH